MGDSARAPENVKARVPAQRLSNVWHRPASLGHARASRRGHCKRSPGNRPCPLTQCRNVCATAAHLIGLSLRAEGVDVLLLLRSQRFISCAKTECSLRNNMTRAKLCELCCLVGTVYAA